MPAGLAIDPDTVLVIRQDSLLTRGDWLIDQDAVEVRPVISGGAGRRGAPPTCRRCRAKAVIEIRRHNAAFCRPCLSKRYVFNRVAVERGFDVVEECPLVAGNSQLRYKDALNRLEAGSPGTKAAFYLGFVDRGSKLLRGPDPVDLGACERCGQLTTGRYCAFCRAVARVRGERSAGPPAEQVAAEISDEVLPTEIDSRAHVP